MDRAAPALESLHALELRVSEGPQRGARAALKAGHACVVATGTDEATDGADIALRDDQAAPASFRFEADILDASIEVLQGQVTLGGEVLTAGRQGAWKAHAPLQIGNTLIAFGRACIEHWPTGTSPGTPAMQPAPSAAGASRSDRAAGGKAASWCRRADVWLAATGTAVLLLCGGVLGLAHLNARPALPLAAAGSADVVTQLSRALKESEFGMLDVTTRGNGQVVIRGRLATVAQRDGLSQWLLGAPMVPALEVTVDEELLHEVAEVFRINGIAAAAQIVGPGRVAAEAAERDAAALARAEEAVRRDVRGLAALTVRNTVAPAPPPAAPVVNDPGKRIASLVAGASAYLVTVDGARYFVGAMLPTGHRIVGIERAAVSLERDGQKTSLNF